MDQAPETIEKQRARRTLAEEAERRVRAGEQAIKVMRDLNIPSATFNRWAARGFWRQIDLQREQDGLPRLPLAYYARRDCGITAGSRKALAKSRLGVVADHKEMDAPADAGVPTELAGLLSTAEALGVQALEYFQSGHTSLAEEKLKGAERLARLHRRLLPHAPPEPTAHQQMKKMTREDMIAEIRRQAKGQAG